jgi:hypothetical protein
MYDNAAHTNKTPTDSVTATENLAEAAMHTTTSGMPPEDCTGVIFAPAHGLKKKGFLFIPMLRNLCTVQKQVQLRQPPF